MSTYALVKFVHVVSSVLLVGTGFGSAFYLFFTIRSGEVDAVVTVARLVVRADWWITTPTAILQPLTGAALIKLGSWPMQVPWIQYSLALYVIAALCWLPVVWLQLRMEDMAFTAQRSNAGLSKTFERFARCWTALGVFAFSAMLAIYYGMIVKPA
jgi:uncharacterized membrane protein